MRGEMDAEGRGRVRNGDEGLDNSIAIVGAIFLQGNLRGLPLKLAGDLLQGRHGVVRGTMVAGWTFVTATGATTGGWCGEERSGVGTARRLGPEGCSEVENISAGRGVAAVDAYGRG